MKSSSSTVTRGLGVLLLLVTMGASAALAQHAPKADGRTIPENESYQSVTVDGTGQLSITLTSGLVAHPPKLQDQVSFHQPLLSGDHRTAGWLADYADPSAPQETSKAIAGRLVLYRAGHVIRSFGTDQTFWSWHFFHQDRDVAFCTGPTHGGASLCELRRIGSGHLLGRWDPRSAGNPPLWVKGPGD